MGPLHTPFAPLAGLLSLVVLAAGCGGSDGVEPRPQARTITAQAGNGQNSSPGTAVPIAPSVLVTDADGNAVSGVPVTFQVTSGGGSVIPATPVNTDAQGVAATTSWTLGAAAGPNTLSATAAGLAGSPVVFTATALTGATISGTITVSNALTAVNAGDLFTRTRPTVHRRLSLASQRAARAPQHSPDELIVRFRPGSISSLPRGASVLAWRSTAAAAASKIRARMVPLLSTHAATLLGVSPAISAARVRVNNPAEMAKVAAALRGDPTVVAVERHGIMWSAQARGTATSGGAGRLSAASNDPSGVLHAWSHGMIDVPEAWSVTRGSASVLVAVIGDGIRFDHPDIAPNLTSDGYDFVSNPDGSEAPICTGGSAELSGDGDGYDPDPTTPTSYFIDFFLGCLEGPEEIASWGSAEAGIIGAVGNNGIGISGINWAVRVRPVRVTGIHGGGVTYDAVQGILYAAGLPADDGAGGVVQAAVGARVITFGLSGTLDEAILRDAVIAGTNAGSLIIAAAGFDGTSTPAYPAAYPEAVATSAVGPDRGPASYSSFGSSIDIAAPGGDFDDGDFSFGIGTTLWDFTTGEPIYALGAGTGIAAAHVTGVAALLLAQEPGLTASQLRSRLIDYAVDAGAPGRDDVYGAGIVNARNSLAQNLEPPRQVHARLYDALTGRAVATTAVAGDGSYSFLASPGSYQVFAGQDESADGIIGLPGRRWGAFGGLGRPSLIEVTGVGSHQASFSVGFPSEREPNETATDANTLPVGGYLIGGTSVADEGGTDAFRVLIAEAGNYTFETSGVDGACGFALEEDTRMALYGPDQSQIAISEDIDTSARDFCSRITTSLQPGAHHLLVRGLRGGSDDVLGQPARYRVQARSGP